MKNPLVKEWEAALDAFFDKATDDEFWATLEEADKGIYGKVDVPIFSLHCTMAQHVWTSRYSIAARPAVAPSGVAREMHYSEVALQRATSTSLCGLAV